MNSDASATVVFNAGSDSYANPSVAFDQTGSGKWIVAWTTQPPAEGGNDLGTQVRGQYFNGGIPMGREFRISQDTTRLGWASDGYSRNIVQRQLGFSGQHTIAYHGALGVVCVWNTIDYPIPPFYSDNNHVYFTILPPGFGEALSACKGDFGYPPGIDGLDIQPFINTIHAPPVRSLCDDPASSYYATIFAGDMNGDARVDLYDVDCFWQTMLFQTGDCLHDAPCMPTAAPFYDLNANGIEDAVDIANGTLHDCNNNGYPDEYELALPFGGATDCNGNGIPDECDITSGYAQDCNGNGVPDSCDIATGYSHDRVPRGGDGIPDECNIGDAPIPVGEDDETQLSCAEVPADLASAWAEYYMWAAQQQWGPNSPLSGPEQYQLIVNKKCELGLLYLQP